MATMSPSAGVPASTVKRRDSWRASQPYLWLLPALLVMGAVLLYPWIYTLVMSMYAWTPLRPTPPRFIGLDNYIYTVADPAFQAAFWNTAMLVVSTVALQFFIGFALALMLNMITVGRGVLTAALLVPLMVTPSVVGLSWKFILHTDWGLANWALRSLGMMPISWLSDPSWTMPAIILVDTWQQTPFTVLVLLAGLQSIPEEPVEAARVDGANDFRIFWHVTVPFLQPLIMTVLLFRLIFAVRAFDIVFALFQSGGPGNAGQVLGVYLYEHLRLTWRLGEGSAISYLLLLITIALGGSILVRWFRNMEA